MRSWIKAISFCSLIMCSLFMVGCHWGNNDYSASDKAMKDRTQSENKDNNLWGSYSFLLKFPYKNLKHFDPDTLFKELIKPGHEVDSAYYIKLFGSRPDDFDDPTYFCSIQKDRPNYKAFTFLLPDDLATGHLVWMSFDANMKKIDEKELAMGIYENGVNEDVRTDFINDSVAVVNTVIYNDSEGSDTDSKPDSINRIIDSVRERVLFRYDGHIKTLKTDSFRIIKRVKNIYLKQDDDEMGD